MGKKKQTIGYWYHLAFHHGLGIGPCDAFLEFRGGDKVAWKGKLTASGTITIDNPNLWGGEKDQGGIVGELEWMNGAPDQLPNAYLSETFGDQQPAWRGLSTVVFKGGKYGAMNPYPQKPSYKIRKIKAGWDCWNPTRAEIPILGDPNSPVLGLFNVGQRVTITSPALAAPDQCTLEMAVNQGMSYTPTDEYLYFWRPNDSFMTYAKGASIGYGNNNADAVRWMVDHGWGFDQTALLKFLAGGLVMCVFSSTAAMPPAPTGRTWTFVESVSTAIGDGYLWISELNPTWVAAPAVAAMNPAHILYYSRTHADMAREPVERINEASFAAAADWFYSQGFGLCTEYDPSKETVEEFEQRICRVAGCGLTRSLIDGQWYIDVANGVYDIAALPILGDDDILDFEEQPTLLDSAVNSVSVKYFDPLKKETITTAPVQAPALIADFGTNHITLDYPEIPSADLAARVAQRELLARITPLRAFSLKASRHPYTWRPSTYFRLQSPKRRIADMVCLLGEKSSGTLRSGAMTLVASQDVYSMPAAAFIEVEEGVDTRPDQTPVPIVDQAAFEAPYVEVAAALSRADLAALPPETGYLLAVAADPSRSRDFTLMVDGGSGYEETATGDWCSTALIVEAANWLDTEYTLSAIQGGSEIELGMPGLWGDEIVRVDAINLETGAVTLARGCADTVPAVHAAGQRIWFYATGAAIDVTEYTDGDALVARLLTNTGSQRLALSDADPLAVTMAGRASRPYPPGAFTVNGAAYPAYAFGVIAVGAAHRDRVLQADQLIDTTVADIGPESGTTYTVRYYADGVLEHTESGIAAFPATYTPAGDCQLRIELESMRDGRASFQMHAHEITYTSAEQSYLLTEGNDYLLLESGDKLRKE